MMADAERVRDSALVNLELVKSSQDRCDTNLKRVDDLQEKMSKREKNLRVDAEKKVEQRDKAYEEVSTLEKRLKVVSALSDKQARENKDLAVKCAKLERELAKASKSSRDPSHKAASPKDSALERERDALVARADEAEKAKSELERERDALAAASAANAAAEAERVRKESATDQATLVANVAEWEAAVKRYRDKIGTAKIALSRVQPDKFAEYRAKCAYLRIKMNDLCGGNPVKDHVLHDPRLDASDRRSLIDIHEALCSALHQTVPRVIGLKDAEKLVYALLA
jgi:chromosome segregation ATPase